MFPAIATYRRALILPAVLAAIVCTATTAAPAWAAEPARAIEQMLAAAQQEKRGVTLYVAGQTIGGAVVRVEAGQWVELRNQQFGRIVVRLDRVDAAAMP